MDRRRFFRPSQLARVAPPLVPFVLPDEPVQLGDLPLLRFSRRAMATTFELAVPFGIPLAQFAAMAALDEIDELESQLTVYRDDSEISLLNTHAHEQPQPVEAQLFSLLGNAQQLWHDTAGAFDIATGALIKAWGFYRRAGRVPTAREQAEAMMQTGFRYVHLDPSSQKVHLLRPGVEFNLGAIGKGYALERAADLLRGRFDIGSALLSGGGSSVVAIGAPPGQSGWCVALQHPTILGAHLGQLRLMDRAMGTSAATFQYFEYNGKKYGHLLDPRQGRPAQGVAHVTVVAPTATQADALSTAFFVLGPEGTRRYCEIHAEIGVVLLPDDPASELMTFNLSQTEFIPSPAIYAPEA